MSTPPRSIGSSWWRGAVLALALLGLNGCAAVAVTALGVGASAGVTHTASGISYRTFTVPAPQVRAASLTALGRMGATVDAVEQREGHEVIRGRYAERQVEVTIEAMSKSSAQMRATLKHNAFVYDAATAKEIVEQTERAVAAADRRVRVGGRSDGVRSASAAL